MNFRPLNKVSGVLLILAFTLLFPLFLISQSQPVDVIAIAHTSGLIAPGMSPVPITFTITNLGSTMYNVNITPLSVYPVSLYNYYNGTESILLPELGSGNSVNVTFLYKIDPQASDGVYKIYIQVTGELADGVEVSKNVSAILPILGYVSVSAQAIWGSLSSPLVVSGGETNVPLTIVLVNSGNVIANNVTLELKSHYPVMFSRSNLTVGYLPIGQPVEVLTYASIYPNATQGTYQIPVEISYFNGVNQTVYMTVDINGYANFSVTTVWGSLNSPITVSAGETQVPLTFIIRNLGDVTVTNVSITLNSTYPVKFYQKSAYVGIIPAGEYNYVTVTASVYPNATPGLYYIPITLNYFQTRITLYAPIEIYSPNISINVFTIPPQIFPGYYDVQIRAIILNYGLSLANNVTVSISSPFKVVSSTQYTLGALPQGVPANITFLVNIPNNTAPGNYLFNFTVKYDGGEFVKQVKVTVYPKANLVIVGVSYPTLNPGATQVPITLTIKNIGNATAKNVKAILGSSNVIYPYVSTSNPLMALTASEAYLGDISPGQEVNVTFVVDISGGISPGNYTMAVTFLWNQTGGLYPFVQNDKFNVQVSPSAINNLESQGVTLQINNTKYTISWLEIIVVVIIIILIVVVAGVRSRRKK